MIYNPGSLPLRRRQGFTLVEMLVATALIIFIMVILTQAFTAGMDTFRQLKAIGDLEEKLRTASTVLRRDLAADHFEGKKRLSDANFWQDGPPREGFFRIWQGSPSTSEGVDGDNIPSWLATNHYLHFTVKRRGNRREEFAYAQVPGGSPLPATGLGGDTRFQIANTFSSQWYEVVYFLKYPVNPGDPDLTAGGVTKRFSLYRRQRLLVSDNTNANWVNTIPLNAANLAAYAEVSCNPNPDAAFSGKLYFNGPMDVTIPQRRFGMDQAKVGGIPTETDQSYPLIGTQNPLLANSDLLLQDVISFNVRVLVDGATDFQDVKDIAGANQNTLFGGTPGVFDTWSKARDDVYDYTQWSVANQTSSAPAQLRIRALQITIRLWDDRAGLTRQITIVQDM